jgi:hypothetical protein
MKEEGRRKKKKWLAKTLMPLRTISNHVKPYRWLSMIKVHLLLLET